MLYKEWSDYITKITFNCSLSVYLAYININLTSISLPGM